MMISGASLSSTMLNTTKFARNMNLSTLTRCFQSPLGQIYDMLANSNFTVVCFTFPNPNKVNGKTIDVDSYKLTLHR